MESVNLDEEEAEERRAEARGSPERQRAEQAPQGPVFDISVGDPHKVGDMTSAHTVYQVRTKVSFALLFSPVSPLYIILHNECKADGNPRRSRQPRKHTATTSSPCPAATATSSGSTAR